MRSASEAAHVFEACCASNAWVARMVAARPFEDTDALLSTARREWWALDPADWLEAFAAHPRIGARAAGASQADRWSGQEQAGVDEAGREIREELARLNDRYVERFGFVFIVCATGKTAEEMLGLLKQRLENHPETELRVGASEQAKIIELRLRKWLAEG